MGRRLAVPDIHGYAATFSTLLREVVKLTRDDVLFLLGDYIDRGPDSKGVIDMIWTLQEQGFDVRPLRGNHEDWMRGIFRDSNYGSTANWLANGGRTTLNSFDSFYLKDVPVRYIEWIETLPFCIETEGYVLVHGGLDLSQDNPVLKTPDLDKMWDAPKGELAWEREYYWPLGRRKLLCGHTPHTLDDIRRAIAGSRVITLDNMVYAEAGLDGLGGLVAFDMDSGELHTQPCIG